MAPVPRRNCNRIAALLSYINPSSETPYSLARETGLPRATLCRIIDGSVCPDFVTVATITEAIERRIGKRLDPREIVAFNGKFLTPNLEDLLGDTNKDAVATASRPSMQFQSV